MKDLKKYSNKTKAAFIILIVMFIILMSNFNTLQNSKKTNEDINTIYKDRLVVARYIFQYTNALYSIKTDAVTTTLNDIQKKNQITLALKNIENIDKLYLKTVLTSKEKTSLNIFLASCSEIFKEAQNKNWSQVNNLSTQALETLELLSQIQSEEGKSKLTNSNTLYTDNTLLGQLQIALLVILGGIALYLLIGKKNKITIKIPEPQSMN
ncbi:hypothetical protein V5J73_03515 [Flavobacterium sp. KS-LB2]|uniref:MCP four helix bundle domain-containing protein n=1 Tax=Flavobacterium sp. KS-LB2 TaxID=3120525 RepID=UPI0030CF5092